MCDSPVHAAPVTRTRSLWARDWTFLSPFHHYRLAHSSCSAPAHGGKEQRDALCRWKGILPQDCCSLRTGFSYYIPKDRNGLQGTPGPIPLTHRRKEPANGGRVSGPPAPPRPQTCAPPVTHQRKNQQGSSLKTSCFSKSLKSTCDLKFHFNTESIIYIGTT